LSFSLVLLAAGLALAERALLTSGIDAEGTDGLIAALWEALQSPLHPSSPTEAA
jgi:hypothetical protein